MGANPTAAAGNRDAWPALPLKDWEETRATLHMWSQMAGKIRLALSPNINHYWGVTLYVNSRGLTTSAIPYGDASFDIQFDFIDHKLIIAKSDGATRTIELAPKSVADFYAELMATLRSLGIEVKIWPMPVEIANPIRFDQDRTHASYDREYVARFWRVLISVDEVFKEFRAEYIGKVSPIHFFWGSFDLAVTRFSGRRAPERPGADKVTKEAYSHEVISVGFWPGNGEGTDAAFYAYAAPRARRLFNRENHSLGRVLRHKNVRVFLALRRSAKIAIAAASSARFCRIHLRRRRHARKLGSRRARTNACTEVNRRTAEFDHVQVPRETAAHFIRSAARPSDPRALLGVRAAETRRRQQL